MISQIDNYLIELGFSLDERRTIICQAVHESGWFKNALTKHANNIFSIKDHARPVAGKLKKTYKGYAVYTDFKGCVNDLIDLGTRRGFIFKAKNIVEYSHFLKKAKYYEADEWEYTEGMKRAYKKLYGNG